MPSQGTTKSPDGFQLVESFSLGYRAREDVTKLPPGVLVKGSQNVLTNISDRIQIRKGYTLDGAASVVLAPILASNDWEMHTGDIRHLRAGFLTNAANDGKLQYRYVATDGTVSWRDLMTSLTSVSFNFTEFWNSTNSQAYLLFVNGSSNIYEWSGGITTFLSATSNTITKEGTTTWAEEGFYVTGSHTVVIGGITYTATGGWGTTTLTGVTPDPTAGGHSAGDVVHQGVTTTANSSITALPDTFENDLIANLRNQIYVGSFISRDVYISEVNSYLDFSFTSPVRLVGEGALVTFDGNPKAFIPQEDRMYFSAGLGQWYETKFTLSDDLTGERFEIARLKTASLQGAQSQAGVSNIGNSIIYVSSEPAISSFGRVESIFATPEITNISDPIKLDVDSYDFSNRSIFYHRKFIYVAVPAEGLVRIFNMERKYWEAPQVLPVSRFYVVDGELYGHSYSTSESYKLFDGYNDNTHPIDARATFSYQNYGTRTALKSFNEYYIEGYMSPNTELQWTNTYEIDGCATEVSYEYVGTDRQIVCLLSDDASLGKVSLGKNPLGSTLALSSVDDLPPKFRVIQTLPSLDFFEHQITISTSQVDANWEILAFGPQSSLSMNQPVAIKQ